MKGLRVAGAKTLEQANAYLEAEYLPEWEAKFTVAAGCADDAHRSLEKQHELAAILSEVESRVVTNDYTIRHAGKVLQIVREDIRPRLRGARVQVEARRNGQIAVRFEGQYLRTVECQPALKNVAQTATATAKSKPAKPKDNDQPRAKSKWMEGFWERRSPSMIKAIKISNATS